MGFIGNIMQIQIKQIDLYFPCVDGNGTLCFIDHQMDTMKIRLRQSKKSLGNLIWEKGVHPLFYYDTSPTKVLGMINEIHNEIQYTQQNLAQENCNSKY